jgi:hypothetical protein
MHPFNQSVYINIYIYIYTYVHAYICVCNLEIHPLSHIQKTILVSFLFLSLFFVLLSLSPFHYLSCSTKSMYMYIVWNFPLFSEFHAIILQRLQLNECHATTNSVFTAGKDGTCGYASACAATAVERLYLYWDAINQWSESLQRSGFDSRRYQISWEIVSLERGPLIFLSTTEDLLERKSSGSCVETIEYGREDPLRRPRDTLYPQKLSLTSPTSGGRSVGTVRLRTQATELIIHTFWHSFQPKRLRYRREKILAFCSKRRILLNKNY